MLLNSETIIYAREVHGYNGMYILYIYNSNNFSNTLSKKELIQQSNN